MDVIRNSINGFDRPKRAVITIGVFDGVHRGHQELISVTVKKARKKRSASVVMTFWPHPLHVLRPDINLPLVVSLEHRLALLEQLGVDVCHVIPFTKRLSKLLPSDFVKKYIKEAYDPTDIFVGDDFRFGQSRYGDVNFFHDAGQRYGFDVHIIPGVKHGGKVISSTRIRRYIQHGKLKYAQQLLGRPVSVMGAVEYGDRRGKTLGFPTANIYPDQEVLPPFGIYLVSVVVGKKSYKGIANVGICPSFKKPQAQPRVEVYILNFNKDIYQKNIIVEFIKKIRDERRFDSPEQLIEQMKKDKKRALEIFSSLT